MSPLFNLFACVPLVTVLPFNGSCPNLVPTHSLLHAQGRGKIDAEVVVGVAFSPGHHSYLFEDIDERISKGYYYYLELEIVETRQYSKSQSTVVTVSSQTFQSIAESYILVQKQSLL